MRGQNSAQVVLTLQQHLKKKMSTSSAAAVAAVVVDVQLEAEEVE
jgi:hypothetical protein